MFPGNEGKPMSKKTIRRRLEKVCNIVGIKRVTPHQLRHSRASALASNGVSIKVIKELLGHSSISTTDIYSHLTPEDLAKQIPPFEWRK